MDNASGDSGLGAERICLATRDNHSISVDCWQPIAGERPSAVIQVCHGLAEHAARYERFAQACVERGIVVAAHSHRGHGETCPPDRLGHFADQDGWDKIVDDALQVRQHLLQQYEGVPLILFGHSMGSYIAQCSVMRHSPGVAGLVLSATTYSSRVKLLIARALARLEIIRIGGSAQSRLLDKISFGDFNNTFAPNRSDFDWLSRDETEVDRYETDPLCGVVSSSRLWHDLTGGLLEITTTSAIRSVPAEMPILIMGGEHDPVGGQSGLDALATKYRSAGHTDTTLKVYAGGRHEMLNEINRDEVTRDIIDWVIDHT